MFTTILTVTGLTVLALIVLIILGFVIRTIHDSLGFLGLALLWSSCVQPLTEIFLSIIGAILEEICKSK